MSEQAADVQWRLIAAAEAARREATEARVAALEEELRHERDRRAAAEDALDYKGELTPLVKQQRAEARVAALTQVAEAARLVDGAYPWMRHEAAGPFGDAINAMRDELAALDGLVGLHEQEQK